MSRRYPRIRAKLTATVTLAENDFVVCNTRDISHRGCFLDTTRIISVGTQVIVVILDEDSGLPLQMNGEVMRSLPPDAEGRGRGVGVRFDNPPTEWTEFVNNFQKANPAVRPPPRRLRVLVVGDRTRQRGAMALYVTSGWDVRFATDLVGAEDALTGVDLNAIIAENDMDDERWRELMMIAREFQPNARRIVRSGLNGRPAPEPTSPDDLFHRVVDRDAGLEALLDALTADFQPGTH
ncbi:MAG: PilZ domain-containing protein [Myxococcota bacterium]